ncbi:MAG: 1-acyl-sn-glycerol-3-phosphate acyltransferase, partial [Pseudomonadota bacterium]
QLANYTKLTLGGSDRVFTLLLSMFIVGIATGSLLCEKLSGRRVEVGLVPLGSIGLTVFGIHLYFAYPGPSGLENLSISEFLQQSGNIRVLADIVLIGVFGGFYIVPLFAMIQQRTAPKKRARVIAAANILNALFMVAAAVIAIVTLQFITIPQLFLGLAIANALVVIYIYALVPEFTLRFFAWLLISTLYRVKPKDLERIPAEGPALLICNHVSFVDPLIIGGTIHRPVRFVMYHKIYNTPLLNYLFRAAKAIPIASRTEDEQMLEQAYTQIAEELNDGRIVCIFPEGQITRSGEINEFKRGVERIVETTPVPVIPMALRGMWGSFFSRYSGRALFTWPRKLWANIGLWVGAPVQPTEVSAEALFQEVSLLRGDER